MFQHFLASAQPPSQREPLPAIYCILDPCVFRLTCCMRVCRFLHFSRFLSPPTLGQTVCFSQNSQAILLPYHWLLKHWFLARFTPTFQVRMCAPHALLSHSSHSRHQGGPCALSFRRDPLPRSLIYVNETSRSATANDVQDIFSHLRHRGTVIEPSLFGCRLGMVFLTSTNLSPSCRASPKHPSSFLYLPNNYAFSSRSASSLVYFRIYNE